ncbi:MAG: hypothetical protein CL608_30925 [Anaerolineaceae bacterium]|nr:hypothetical protein [Anaerolineaceae bacterium]
MKHKLHYLISIFFALFLMACQAERTTVEVAASSSQISLSNTLVSDRTNTASEIINENRCQNPTAQYLQNCLAWEEQILAVTVRIEIHRWLSEEGVRGEYIDGSGGHATVIDGRYLITHNHFSIPLESIEGTSGERLRISVYKANGELILDSMRPTAFTIVAQDQETVVLDFGEYVDEGLFDMLDIPSAEFQSWESLALSPGAEVAQINWDNQTAFVEWVNIRSLVTAEGTPRIELDNGVIKGASGGGIFWNGVHIGNNWTSTTVKAANDGVVLDEFSTAALNSKWVGN